MFHVHTVYILFAREIKCFTLEGLIVEKRGFISVSVITCMVRLHSLWNILRVWGKNCARVIPTNTLK